MISELSVWLQCKNWLLVDRSRPAIEYIRAYSDCTITISNRLIGVVDEMMISDRRGKEDEVGWMAGESWLLDLTKITQSIQHSLSPPWWYLPFLSSSIFKPLQSFSISSVPCPRSCGVDDDALNLISSPARVRFRWRIQRLGMTGEEEEFGNTLNFSGSQKCKFCFLLLSEKKELLRVPWFNDAAGHPLGWGGPAQFSIGIVMMLGKVCLRNVAWLGNLHLDPLRDWCYCWACALFWWWSWVLLVDITSSSSSPSSYYSELMLKKRVTGLLIN